MCGSVVRQCCLLFLCLLPTLSVFRNKVIFGSVMISMAINKMVITMTIIIEIMKKKYLGTQREEKKKNIVIRAMIKYVQNQLNSGITQLVLLERV